MIKLTKLLHYTKEVRLDDFIEEGETVYDNAWVKAMEALSNGGRLILPPKTLNFEPAYSNTPQPTIAKPGSMPRITIKYPFLQSKHKNLKYIIT